MTRPFSLEQFLHRLCDRSAQAVIAQAGIDSEPLRRHLRTLLAAPPGARYSFLSDPVFEGSFGWKPSEMTIAELSGDLLHPALIDVLDAPVRSPDRVGEAYRFAKNWHPHAHQAEAWRMLSDQEPRSVLVTSGTGSGKTECFLIPILDGLVRQHVEGELTPGVQALFLYPLNALINSQRDRLTDWTHAFGGAIRYCLYNGETEKEVPQSIQELTPSRILSRKLLRAQPPQILVTNITMLEYMLLRSQDAPIIGKSKGRLRWVVIDEAHSYIGSQAAELALLLRRVMLAFGVRAEEVRFVATSATIGQGGDTRERLQRFLAGLAGVPTDRVSVIEGTPRLRALEGTTLDLPLSDLEALSDEDIARLLPQSMTVRALRDELAKGPRTLTALSRIVDPGTESRSTTLRLLEKAAHARGPDGPLLPLRIHLFHRPQPGLWACVDPKCRGRHSTPLDHPEWPFGAISTSESERCEHCGAPTFELVRCQHCSRPYLMAEERDDRLCRVTSVDEVDEFSQDVDPIHMDEPEDNPSPTCGGALRRLLTPPGENDSHPSPLNRETSALLSRPSEDALTVWMANPENCPRCGAVHNPAHGELFRSARFGAPFLLGNIVPEVLEWSPAREGKSEELPFQGRQLITFTDSRQGTARLSAKLQQDAERTFVRSVVYHAVQSILDADASELPSKKLSQQIAGLDKAISALGGRESPQAADLVAMVREFERQQAALSEHISSLTWTEMRSRLADQPAVHTWMMDIWERRGFSTPGALSELILYRDFLRRPLRQNSVETMGLASLRFDVIDGLTEHDLPAAFQRLGASIADWRDFLYIFVTYFLRANTAVGISADDLRWMGRPGKPKVVKGPGEDAARKKSEIPWPQVSSAARTTRVARILAVGLGLDLDDPTDRSLANECLRDAWTVLWKLNVPGGSHLQLDLRKAKFAPLTKAWICPATRRLVDHTLRGITPNLPLTSPGKVDFRARPIDLPQLAFPWGREHSKPVTSERIRQWLGDDPVVRAARDLGVWTDFHDRVAQVAPYLRSAEHSAQQPSARLQRYERKFREGEINVLNCSTTMEMGVDIGGIGAVLMTNVPPAPANYRQRVGRAGRRGEALALGLTFCGDNLGGWRSFRNPIWPFEQQIRPPQVSLDSPVIVQRHVNALLLSRFLLSLDEAPSDNLLKLPAGWFFSAGQRSSPCQDFIHWCSSAGTGLPEEVIALIEALVADTCLESQADLRHSTAETMDQIRESWMTEFGNLTEDAKHLAREDKAAQGSIQMQIKRMEKSFLLSELAARGFLPAHGFPSHVVPFVVGRDDSADHEQSERSGNRATFRSYPTRDLALAIRDYAPGNEVVLDGLVYRSQGLTLNWHRPASDDDAHEIQALGTAWKCPRCGTTDTSATRPELCSACGETLETRDLMAFIRPAGFTVDRFAKAHTDVATLSHLPPSPPWISARGGRWVPLPDPRIGRFRASREGHVFHYTRTPGKLGFAICLHCGRAAAETGPPGKQAPPLPPAMVDHYPLRGAAKRSSEGLCPGNGRPFGIKRHLALGHGYSTDVYELQLFGLIDETIATSIAVALREALAIELGIESAELGWSTVLSPDDRGGVCQSLLVYDNAAGGAGFSSAAGALTTELLSRALTILDCANPDCVTACHACLLTRDTMHDAALIDRRKAMEYLLSNVADHLRLEAEYMVFGPATRQEHVPLPEALDRFMSTNPLSQMRIFLHGRAAEWDLVEWPLRPVLDKWGTKEGRIELIAEQHTIASLASSQKLALGRLLERSRAGLLAINIAPRSPKHLGLPVASIGVSGNHRMWAVTAADAALPNEAWGTSAGAPVVYGRSPAPLCEDARVIDVESLLMAPSGASAMVVSVLDQLNGPAAQFGQGFWDIILARKPEIGQLIQSGPLTAVTYQDRYLFNPLALRLLGEVLKQAAANSSAPIALTIRTLAARQMGSMGTPFRIWHDWANGEHRKDVIREYLRALGYEVRLNLGQLSELPHDRTLHLSWKAGEVTIHLDQGFGHWQSAKSANFDFGAPPARQAAALKALAIDIVNRTNHPMAVFVHEPIMGI